MRTRAGGLEVSDMALHCVVCLRRFGASLRSVDFRDCPSDISPSAVFALVEGNSKSASHTCKLLSVNGRIQNVDERLT